MIDLTFDVDGTITKTEVDGITYEYRGVLSIQYEYRILISNVSSVVLSTISTGVHIRIYTGHGGDTKFLAEGMLVKLYNYVDRKVAYTQMVIQDLGFVGLSETYCTDMLAGELSGIIKSVTGLNVRKTYSGGISIYRHVSGRCMDIISDIAKEKEKVWNIKGNNIWIGDVLSDKEISIDPSNVHIFFGRTRDDDGNIIKVTDMQLTRFRPDVQPGDRVKVKDRIYIIVVVNHKYVDTQKTLLRATYLKAVTVIEEAYKLVQYYDSERRIDEISEYNNPDIIYDNEFGALAFFDHKRGLYLGDLQVTRFTGNSVGPLLEYLYVGNVQTSATIGIHMPCDMMIVCITSNSDVTDDAHIHVTRNGEIVSTITLVERTQIYEEKRDIFGAGGVMGCVYHPHAGPAGIGKIIINVHYRWIVRYE